MQNANNKCQVVDFRMFWNAVKARALLPFFASPISSVTKPFCKRIVINFQLCDLKCNDR